VKRRKRGRPQRDYSDDPDLVVAELAVAMMIKWDISERAALDRALHEWEGERLPPSKIPRGTPPGAIVIGSRLPGGRSFASRSSDIRRKFKLGKLRPRLSIIFRFVRLLPDIPSGND
jgi:hypothetical protein